MTYEQAVQYLEEASSFGIKPGLERINALLAELGNPEKSYKIVHVAGTNGKGSVTTYVSYALFNSGLRVGRFTSPHLEAYTERMQINDATISNDGFGALIDRVKPAVEAIIAKGVEAPTQFEILTAAAFLFFQEQEVDYAVVEAGLGGLLDSTNVVTPVVSVITNVTVDHQAYCGNSVEEIAQHKAGIIKEGIPVVTAAQEGALVVIEEVAKAKHAPLYIFNKRFGIDSRSSMKTGQMVTVSTEDGQPAMLFTSMVGIHQSVNIACALMTVRLLMDLDSSISEETMREGFARATWPGRFEIRKYNDRTYIFDGAHNAAGAEAFGMTYAELFKDTPKTIIMAILSDKDEQSIIREVVKPHDTVYTVLAPTSRSENPLTLGNIISDMVKDINVEVSTGVSEALKVATEQSQSGDVIVVCGSLYILGEARQWLFGQMSH